MKTVSPMVKMLVAAVAICVLLVYASHRKTVVPEVTSDQYRNGFYAGCVMAYHKNHMLPADTKKECMKSTLEATEGLTFSEGSYKQFKEFTDIINSYLEQYKT